MNISDYYEQVKQDKDKKLEEVIKPGSVQYDLFEKISSDY